MKKRIFLVWAKTARRSTTLAKLLDAKLIILTIDRSILFIRLIKYLILAIRTFIILLREKPDLVFVQCPPVQILFPVYFYAKFRGSKFVIDAHTGAFIGKGTHFPVYLRWLNFFSRRASMTIIPNDGIVKYLIKWGIPYFILEDGIPDFVFSPAGEKPGKSIAVISGFGTDEPLGEMIEASKRVPAVQFFITGSYSKEWLNLPIVNLKFTGFLTEIDFIKLLSEVSLVMVLTTRPDTILCGAYEGLSLEKPMILSDTATLRSHFPKGVIHVENTAEGIAKGIKQAFSVLPQLQAEILQLKSEKTRQWLEKTKKLKELLEISDQN